MQELSIFFLDGETIFSPNIISHGAISYNTNRSEAGIINRGPTLFLGECPAGLGHISGI